MKKTYFYTLSDPRSIDNIRYVGKSDTPFERYNSHLHEKGNYHRCYWISSLKKEGLKPYLEIIDEIEYNTKKDWEFWEKHYISLYKSWGFDLVNGTIGGDGIDKGHKMPPRSLEHMERIKTSKIKNGTWCKSHSLETKKKLRLKQLGVKPSEETKLKRKATIASWPEDKLKAYNEARTKHWRLYTRSAFITK